MSMASSHGQDSLPFHRRTPPEWRYSDADAGPPAQLEDALGKVLADPKSPERESAATQLWRNRSFVHAKAVIELAEANHGSLESEVAAGLKPESLRKELESADPRWGLWLAYLRPQAGLVDALLEKSRGSFQTGALLALGRSGDRRALVPLLARLKDGNPAQRGFAARALGDLGLVEAEAGLLVALSSNDNSWLQVNACESLAKIGTNQAIPSLQRLAEARPPAGALNSQACAAHAIREIQARNRNQ
jgi:HEAT repeat protein